MQSVTYAQSHLRRIHASLPRIMLRTAVLVMIMVSPLVLVGQTPQDRSPVNVPSLPQDRDDLRAVVAESYVVTPERRDASEELVAQLNMPEGFRVEIFAEGLGNSRIVTVSDEGHIYVTRRDEGAVALIQDTNGDNRADRIVDVATGLENVHGLAIRNNRLYMVTNKELYAADILEDGTLGEIEQLRDDLPDAGQHPNRTMGIGPDDMLYLSIGSTCNDCKEPRREHATMLRMNSDGSEQVIFAEGLRNTIGFGWHPVTGEFWGMDHNSDGRGNDIPPEQLNRIEQGKHYGWPWCYGDREVDYYTPEAPPNDLTREQFCAETEPMVLGYTAHAAPMAMAFYTGETFPEEYQNDAFVAMRGSWNRNPPVGYEVARVRFDDNGQPASIEPFITGWLVEEGRAHFGRLVGVAVHTDGSLLIAEDTNGVLYRVTYGE